MPSSRRVSAPVRAVTVRAHAKINLDLRVLGTRPDGFHELRTVFQTLALHDTLTVRPTRGPMVLTCDRPDVPSDRSNLVWRAAEALWRSLRRPGRPAGVALHLEKRIPMEAGLGGGSADAAATLVGLSAAWAVEVSAGRLAEIGASLGADVPFFLTGGTGLGLGRGDEIYPLADLPAYWMVLLTPRFGVSSRDAFGWWDAWHGGAAESAPRRSPRLPAPWPAVVRLGNDLEAPIAARHPEIDGMKAALTGVGALAASMTGSGSTVFGLFQDRPACVRAARALVDTGWQVTVSRSLGRTAYSRSLRPVGVRPVPGRRRG